MRPEVVGKLPLPLGEAGVRGLATKRKILLLSPFLSEWKGKKDEGEFSFLVTQLRPHPNPLPKGEGVCLRNPGILDKLRLVGHLGHMR